MNNETIIKIIQALTDNDLLLIDTGETLVKCDLEVHRKKKTNKKEIILFVVKEQD